MRERCSAPCRLVKLLKVDRVNGVHLVLPAPYKPGDTVMVEMIAEADDSGTVRLTIQKFNMDVLQEWVKEVREE